MLGFRILLVAFLGALGIYTAITVGNQGVNLLSYFFEAISEMGWQGQFNLDFAMFLVLSALWTAWRHEFSPAGLGLGAVASVGGMLFLATYLLILSFQTKGDIRQILLGTARA